jgi:hypothetical protein
MSAPRTRDGRRVPAGLTPQQRLAQGVPGASQPQWHRPPGADAMRYGRVLWLLLMAGSAVAVLTGHVPSFFAGA